MQLAIDTSTNYAGVALVQGLQVIAELSWRCESNHSVELTPRIETLLAQSRSSVNELDAIFVAKGPGSFNGLRVGVSTAKGLAFSLGIPIIGISTLEYTAYHFAHCGLPVCAVQNAGREEVAAAVYQRKPRKGWTCLLAEQITTIAGLRKSLQGKTLFCGDFNEDTAAQIKKMFKTGALLPSAAAQVRRAAYLAELGQARLTAGSADNPSTLQPLYLRRPPITERKKPF
jgi:tRNA threonylcarbamoyl adenosine modification protein YeaZ